MVVTGQGKLGECLDGLGLEPLSIKGFYLLGRFGQRIVIESGRDICIKLIIIGKIVFGVHKPLSIAKDGNLDIGCCHLQTIEFGKNNIKFWRPSRIKYNYIGESTAECLTELLFR